MADNLRVLVVGKGGTEHALAWKLSQSPLVNRVYVLPGNAGTGHGLRNVSNIDNVPIDQYEAVVEVGKRLIVGLVVVGPDSAVVDGIEGHFRRAKVPCFAPTKEAAKIEGSKAYAKDFMSRHRIPTAEYRTFIDFDEASAYIQSVDHNVVIKADGLAAGKGVVIPATKAEAITALQAIMELSVSTLSDGETTVTLAVGQDHKRARGGDKGPNTGGMGVDAPVPAATKAVMERIESEVLGPTFEGLRREGRAFKGLLFTGIMLTDSGPKVLEYNARFDDPETQSIIPLLGTEVDLARALSACTEGRLQEVEISISPLFACNVVVAAGGYPEPFRTGDFVELEPLPKDCIIFHSGTRLEDGHIVTAGGRVFTMVGLGETLKEAVSHAYQGVRSIKFPDMFYRTDIAFRAISD